MSQSSELRPQPVLMVRPRRGAKVREFDKKLQAALDSGRHIHVHNPTGIKCVSRHCRFPQMDG